MPAVTINMSEFDRLYAEYKPRFIVIANAVLRDKTLAEDLVTDGFLYFWEKRAEIALVADNIPAYILGIIRHKCIDALRERQSRFHAQQHIYQDQLRAIRENLEVLEECDLSKILFHRDVEEIFRRRLAEMPELTAQVFMASRFEELTYEEIAHKYNLSVRQVTRKIQQCLKILRDDLGDYLPLALLIASQTWHK